MKAIRRFTVRTVLPEPLRPLRDLMLNLRWSWHPQTVDLFASIDPAAWEASAGDPIRMLSTLQPERLAALASDHDFLARLNAATRDMNGYLTEPRWFERATGFSDAGDGPLVAAPAAIAYFSPEYGITEVLPQYSGGLGILAGDHLKAASDLGVPLIGVGLLYRHGYFTQSLSADGWQGERYPSNDPNGLPLELLRDSGGTPVRITLTMAEGHVLSAQVWLARVGRVPLLLLDSYVEENEPALQEVTDRLYGGGTEHRLRQELLLGIGGMRAVRAFCAITGHPEPEVFHTNEGHAGFLGLERIRTYADQGLSFDEALEACRAGTVFTTHTPVPAGIDRFPRDLIERYLSKDAADPALPVDRVLALGAETYPGGDLHVFNMAVMGMRLAQRANGVSKLHGAVSREMFSGLWPGFEETEVPIGSITNGVHPATWVATEILELANPGAEVLSEGGNWDWDRVADLPADRIWAARRTLRSSLVADARKRLRASWRQRGASEAELTWIDEVLDPDRLTIGFARRVPSYKRLTLMLHDPDRLTELLLDSRAADPDRDRRQGAPGRRGRQAADPADGPVHRRPAGPGPDRLPARLRHPDGALAGARLRRLAEQPAPPARGLRDLGDEGGAERRAEPVGARRLVGRVVRRRQRLGDPLRRRRVGPGPPGRAGSLGALRPAQQLGGAAVLRPGRGRGAGRLGREDPAHAPGAGPARAGGAYGPRVRHQAVRPRHPVVPGAGRRRELPCRP